MIFLMAKILFIPFIIIASLWYGVDKSFSFFKAKWKALDRLKKKKPKSK